MRNKSKLRASTMLASRCSSVNVVVMAAALAAPRAASEAAPSPPEQHCTLFFAESSVQPGRHGVYSALDRSKGDAVASPDIFITLFDANPNEFSPWMDAAWSPAAFPSVWGESNYLQYILYPGLSSMMACSDLYWNVEPDGLDQMDAAGTHRSTHPSAGSFTYYHNSGYSFVRAVMRGEELVVPCPTSGAGEPPVAQRSASKFSSSGRKILSSEFLVRSGVCLEGTLKAGLSTIKGAGRGAFVTRSYSKGTVVASSPVLPLDKSQLEIVEQGDYPANHWTPFQRDHGILYNSSHVVGRQLLTNYVLSSKESNVVLFPVAPHVNLINHATARNSNVVLKWSRELHLNGRRAKHMRPMELLSRPVPYTNVEEPGDDLDGQREEGSWLVIEYVATRDLVEGEELLMDYGAGWDEAWRNHVIKFQQQRQSNGAYQSAQEYLELHRNEPYRTAAEQKDFPYPDNLQTACYIAPPSEEEDDDSYDEDDEENEVEWSDKYLSVCLRPCDIQERSQGDGASPYYYTVVVRNPESSAPVPEWCGPELGPEGATVTGVPHDLVTLQDKPYTGDVHLPSAFRREIDVPPDFSYPSAWSSHDPHPDGDFAGDVDADDATRKTGRPLSPGQLESVRWKDTGEVVTPWAFRVGLPSRVREVLLEYCRLKGIAQALRHVTVEGNGFLPGQESRMVLDGQEWFLQRPGKKWNSNLHWLSPNGHEAHEDYLQALQVAGFDSVLQSIGDHLQLDGLVAFHVTFIGVSQAIRGYVHIDVSQTQAKTYNVIIPLILAENVSGPELDLQGGQDTDRYGRVGRYRYVYDEGAMMGDDAYHATSSVDYRLSKEMRLAATVYIADVNEQNVERIMEEYTQAFPPQDAKLLMSWSGRHWKPGDPTKKLPEPSKDHILRRAGLVLPTSADARNGTVASTPDASAKAEASRSTRQGGLAAHAAVNNDGSEL